MLVALCGRSFTYAVLNTVDDGVRICSIYEKGISLSATSKVYGLPGLRVGWIACRDKVFLSKVAETKHYMSICNSAPSEILALIALRAKHTILRRNKAIARENMAMMDAFIARHPDLFSWAPPRAGCCGFVKCLTLPAHSTQLEAIAVHLMNEFKLLILPGINFPIQINKKHGAKPNNQVDLPSESALEPDEKAALTYEESEK
eukprot:gene35819-48161_t